MSRRGFLESQSEPSPGVRAPSAEGKQCEPELNVVWHHWNVKASADSGWLGNAVPSGDAANGFREFGRQSGRLREDYIQF